MGYDNKIRLSMPLDFETYQNVFVKSITKF